MDTRSHESRRHIDEDRTLVVETGVDVDEGQQVGNVNPSVGHP